MGHLPSWAVSFCCQLIIGLLGLCTHLAHADSTPAITLTPCDPALEQYKASDIEVSQDSIHIIANCEVTATRDINRHRLELPNTLGLPKQAPQPLQLEYAPRINSIDALPLSYVRRSSPKSATIELIPDHGSPCAQLLVNQTTPVPPTRRHLLEDVSLRVQMDQACQVASLELDETMILMPLDQARTVQLGPLSIELLPLPSKPVPADAVRKLPLLKPIEQHKDYVMYAPCGTTKTLPDMTVRLGVEGNVLAASCQEQYNREPSKVYRIEEPSTPDTHLRILRNDYAYGDLGEPWRMDRNSSKPDWLWSITLLNSEQQACAQVSFNPVGKRMYPKRFNLRPLFWLTTPDIIMDKHCKTIGIQIMDRIILVKGQPHKMQGRIYGLQFEIERFNNHQTQAALELTHAQP